MNATALKAPLAKCLDPTVRDSDIVGESVALAQVMRGQFYKLLQICEMHVMNKPVESRFCCFEGKKGTCQEFDKAQVFRNVRMKVIVGGPEHRLDNPITRHYVKRITKAQEDIVLAHLQFYPHQEILDALKQKKKEGVPIILVTPGVKDKSCFGRCVQVWISRSNYDIPSEVYEYQVTKQLFHKKIGVFDSKYTVIGSYNLGRKSSLYDHELICVIKDAAVSARVKKILDTDMHSCSLEVRGLVLKYCIWNKIFAGLLSPFKRFF